MNRYRSDGTLRSGTLKKSARGIARIRLAVRNGDLSITTRVLKEGESLDRIAGETYGDSRLWWVIASASGIGWAPQAPPGTFLRIPTDLSQIGGLV